MCGSVWGEHMNSVPTEVRRGFQISWRGSYRELGCWELSSLLIIGPSLQLYNPLFKNLFLNKTVF